MFAGHILCFRLGDGESISHQLTESSETVSGEQEWSGDAVGSMAPPVSPKNVRAHGTRAQASSLAAFSGLDATRICIAPVWSNLHTFCKHYRTQQLWEALGISMKVLSAASNDNPWVSVAFSILLKRQEASSPLDLNDAYADLLGRRS